MCSIRNGERIIFKKFDFWTTVVIFLSEETSCFGLNVGAGGTPREGQNALPMAAAGNEGRLEAQSGQVRLR